MSDKWVGKRLVAAARIARWERTIEQALLALIAKREAATLAAIDGSSLTAGLADAWSGFDTWDQDVDADIAPIVQVVLDEAVGVVVDAFGMRGKLNPIDVTSRVEHLLASVRGIGVEESHRIAEALTQGAALGESIPKLTARVAAAYDVARTDARRIARTETIGAANDAGHDMAGALYGQGIVSTKTWLATSDERTRPDHVEADGQSVPFDEPFDVGGEAMDYPGDSGGSDAQVMNCRCTTTYE